MPVAKKRKVTASLSKNSPAAGRSITAFTKVYKPQLISKSLCDKSDQFATTQSVKPFESDRKRKIILVEEVTLDAEADQASEILRATINQSQREIKPLPRSYSNHSIPETPKKPILVPSAPSSTVTPTKGARGLFDDLRLSSSSVRKQAPSPLCPQQSIQTNEKSPSYDTVAVDQNRLPIELLDLINLHSSFLTALALHHAHNGTHSPADLRLLCPDVARAWGKRKVLLDDIRRILGVLNSGTEEEGNSKHTPLAQLNLSDYGHGKICVETKTRIGRARKIARPLDENRLNDAFSANLQILWEEYTKTGDNSITEFVQRLPLETITICSSLTKMSPLLAKGQRRLEDLRAGIIIKKQTENDNDISGAARDTKGTKLSLLERLKAKELRCSTLPAPPSKAELSRNAALHRLAEVVAVLTLLTTSGSIGQQRVSFTLPTVIGKLRDSFKTPMSKEEAETCVRLLASDISPEWLRIVKMGKFDAVVVNRDNRPSDLDIQERVKSAT